MANETRVVLLRAVMPSGRNKVAMADLREVLRADGFRNVRTYIQTGNVLLDSELSASAIARRVHDLIERHLGPDLVVVVRSPTELREVLDHDPFRGQGDPSRTFFVLFTRTPPEDQVKDLLASDFGDERLAIRGAAAYLHIPGQYGRGKLSNNFLEKQLGVPATMRNRNTLTKLVAMADEGSKGRGGSKGGDR